jgi:hypothetical protein
MMPGSVSVGFGLCALKSADHCIAAASAHIGGSPTARGFPGIQVKPLFPSRNATMPRAFALIILADFAMSVGPADIARAIFACVVSPISAVEL